LVLRQPTLGFTNIVMRQHAVGAKSADANIFQLSAMSAMFYNKKAKL